MIKNSLVIIIFFISSQLFGQQSFPESWVGLYAGELQIFAVDSVSMSLQMKLNIEKKKDSVYQWRMTYITSDNEDVRDYELHIIDREKGRYDIDEKNTIVLEGYFKSGIYTSFFEVQNNMIIASYSKIGKDLQFEIISANGNKFSISGNGTLGGEPIPEVRSYRVNGRQQCLLRKIN